jgi:hypothetical protein
MSAELHEILNAIIELLQLCGWEERATWFIAKQETLNQFPDLGDSRVQEAVSELRSVLAGQGSLTDLPLSPSPTSGLSRNDARKRQWELAKRLDALLDVATNP